MVIYRIFTYVGLFFLSLNIFAAETNNSSQPFINILIYPNQKFEKTYGAKTDYECIFARVDVHNECKHNIFSKVVKGDLLYSHFERTINESFSYPLHHHHLLEDRSVEDGEIKSLRIFKACEGNTFQQIKLEPNLIRGVARFLSFETEPEFPPTCKDFILCAYGTDEWEDGDEPSDYGLKEDTNVSEASLDINQLIVLFDDKGEWIHYALCLGSGLFMSKFGSGPIHVSTLQGLFNLYGTTKIGRLYVDKNP